jgi:hypothetical protein
VAETIAFVLVLVGMMVAYEIGRLHGRTTTIREFMDSRAGAPPRPSIETTAELEKPPTNRRT